jgi:3-hydroxyacyl-CoA dehydrogenase/enoyl-CoA hydratase/3-hydroxybutyryl-CoA epimerase
MGPFRLIDEVGIDIAAEVGRTLCSAFPYLPASALLARAGESGQKGRKGGAGFYRYEGGRETGPNPAIGGLPGLTSGRHATDADLSRLLLLMVNEAGRCLEEGVVAEAADVDAGLLFGTGFPPFHGGLCRWADRQGLARLLAELEALAVQHGERFAPCGHLRGRASFYG